MTTTTEWFNEIDHDLDNKISNLELRVAVYLLGVFLTPLETQQLRVIISQGRAGPLDLVMFSRFFPDPDRRAAEQFLLRVIHKQIKRVATISVLMAFLLLAEITGVVGFIVLTDFWLRIAASVFTTIAFVAALQVVIKHFMKKREIKDLRRSRRIPAELQVYQ